MGEEPTGWTTSTTSMVWDLTLRNRHSIYKDLTFYAYTLQLPCHPCLLCRCCPHRRHVHRLPGCGSGLWHSWHAGCAGPGPGLKPDGLPHNLRHRVSATLLWCRLCASGRLAQGEIRSVVQCVADCLGSNGLSSTVCCRLACCNWLKCVQQAVGDSAAAAFFLIYSSKPQQVSLSVCTLTAHTPHGFVAQRVGFCQSSCMLHVFSLLYYRVPNQAKHQWYRWLSCQTRPARQANCGSSLHGDVL